VIGDGGAINDSGAIYSLGVTGLKSLTGCTFADNSASVDGGAIYLPNTAQPLITDCTFVGNMAQDGGAIYHDQYGGGISPLFDGQTFLTNCTLTQNIAAEGSAIYDAGGATAVLMQCTVVDNTASSGAAIYSPSNVAPYVTTIVVNSIVANNLDETGTPDDIANPGATAAIRVASSVRTINSM
jgi:predicted outer membrane repeat protein